MKIRSFARKAIALALLSGAALGVNATTSSTTTTDLGPIGVGVPTPFGNVVFDTFFSDFFTFSLPANGGSGYSVAALDIYGPLPSLTPYFVTQLSTFTLFSNPDGIVGNSDDDIVVPGVVISNNNKAKSFTVGALPTGSYYLWVVGMTSGDLGGTYNGAISVTAVPEPESYALFLAGLGIMGAIARRRSKANAV